MSENEPKQPGQPNESPGWRIKVGFALFLFSLIGFPLMVPILALLGVPGARVAAITGGLLVASEVTMLVGAAIAGKEGFAYIKAKVFGFLKPYGPPRTVGRTRYRIGLVMFALPLLLGLAIPYAGDRIPGFQENILVIGVGGDVLLAASLFVLGGDFWEKLRSLFIHRATATIPEKPVTH